MEYEQRPSIEVYGQAVYGIDIKDNGSSLEMSVSREHVPTNKTSPGKIEIWGLRKYLGRLERVTVKTKLYDVTDVFHVWVAIERALVKRSKFFSLIDIYGHYANRGDTVKVHGTYGFDRSKPLNRMLDWLTHSNVCGGFHDRPDVCEELDLNDETLENLIYRLREERFDVRTKRTHPIIQSDQVICTYPFPLLSAKALTVSRADISDEDGLQEAGRAS
jgi:DNA (cytosine-5)-methyltransferase 1